MRAVCVDKNVWKDLTAGRVYDIAPDISTSSIRVIDDAGDSVTYPTELFQLLPDEPKQTEWMPLSDYTYVNMVTGMFISFELEKINQIVRRRAYIYPGGVESLAWYAYDDYASAFAALVGYAWKEG